MDGWYYITICAKDKENVFGEYNPNSVGVDGCRPSNKIIINEFGSIVDDELNKSGKIRNEIYLDEYVIMPNHIHAIIIIKNNIENHSVKGGQPAAPTIFNGKRSLSSFVAGLKSTVTKRINVLRGTPQKPVWQRSFYDHVICNEKSLHEIRQYIHNNPINWALDENNIKNQ